MTVDRIRQQFQAQLRAAELVHWPFPHLVLRNVLPGDLYVALVDANPFEIDPGRRFGHPSWTSRLDFPHFYDHRFQHDLHPDRRTLPPSAWDAVGDAFSDPTWLGPILRARYPEFFELRFGDIDAIDAHPGGGGFWRQLQTQTFLQRHEPGYQLDAHTDIPSRVATCIFSLPRESGHEAAGTQLLVPNNPRWRCSGNRHHPIDGFRVVATAPYAPNTCLVFFKTRHSWHGVAPDAATVPAGRFGMQVQLYEPESGAVDDLSAPDLVVNRQLHPIGPATRAWRRARSLTARVLHRR